MPQFPRKCRCRHSHYVYWIHSLAGEGRLSGRLRAGRRRGACRGKGSLRPAPASPEGHLWRASRRRPAAPRPPATPVGAGRRSTPRPAPGPRPQLGQVPRTPPRDPAPSSRPLPLLEPPRLSRPSPGLSPGPARVGRGCFPQAPGRTADLARFRPGPESPPSPHPDPAPSCGRCSLPASAVPPSCGPRRSWPCCWTWLRHGTG